MDAVREPAIKTRARIGWVLLAAALATPTLMGAAGLITSFKAGEFTVQIGFSWLVAAVVSDLILRKWGSDTKAKGRNQVVQRAHPGMEFRNDRDPRN